MGVLIEDMDDMELKEEDVADRARWRRTIYSGSP